MSENISDELGRILEVFEQWGDGVATVELIPSGEKKNMVLQPHQPGQYNVGEIHSVSADEETLLP